MRYEPANAKFFETEVRWKSLSAALKLLGCFDPSKSQFEPRTNNDFVKRGFDVFETFFCTLDEKCLNDQSQAAKSIQHYQIDEKLVFVCYIMRFLYDTALDSFERLTRNFCSFLSIGYLFLKNNYFSLRVNRMFRAAVIGYKP